MSTEDQRGSNNPNANPNAPASGGADSGAGASGEAPRAPNPNARLRELLSIPERLRTDAQWDEIIEIEISMGPRKPSGNFSKSPNQSKSNQSPLRQNERGDRPDNKKPMGGGGKHSHSRKRRPGGGGGGGGGGHGKSE